MFDRGLFAGWGLQSIGLDFFSVFWSLIALWYAAQIAIVSKILRTQGWAWRDIGYIADRKRTLWLVGGYLVVGFGLVALIELALANAQIDPERLSAMSDLADLTPRTTVDRIVFVLMGLVAGRSEEIVYRGFAINALRSLRVGRWLAVALAAVPFVFQRGLKSLDQFWGFLVWSLAFGALLLRTRRLWIGIVVHWLVILPALPAILQALR